MAKKTDFPTTPNVKDGQATLKWLNEFGETITVELDTDKVSVPVPSSVLQKSRLDESLLERLPLLIHHSDNLIPCPLVPLITTIPGFPWPVLITGTDGNKYILAVNEAAFIEHACKVLIEYGSEMQKQ
jgi:hypothetical protein